MDKEMLYVVLPCYNEEENISELIKEWNSHKAELEKENTRLKLVIVNDGSIDRTLSITKGLEKVYDNIVIINHEKNKGLGEALNSGINYAVSQKERGFLCVMDADMTHDPGYIHSMLNKARREKLHCIIASRYQKGSSVEGLSLYRKLLSYGARAVYTVNLRIPYVRDYTCGYRLYRLEILDALYEKYDGKILHENGFACMMELLVKISKAGYKIGEIPFVLKYQLKGGESKMRVWRTVYRSLLMVMRF